MPGARLQTRKSVHYRVGKRTHFTDGEFEAISSEAPRLGHTTGFLEEAKLRSEPSVFHCVTDPSVGELIVTDTGATVLNWPVNIYETWRNKAPCHPGRKASPILALTNNSADHNSSHHPVRTYSDPGAGSPFRPRANPVRQVLSFPLYRGGQ